MRRIDGIIEVEEVLEIIEAGTTMPVRCRLENGLNVIVKYMKNPFGQKVLINELVGSCIADDIGLTIPEYGICNLSDDVINTTNTNEEIDWRNAGYAFFSKEYSSTAPPVRSLLSLIENKQTEKLILFDHIVNNCDRHIGNLLLDVSKSARLLIIDNSHIITKGIETDIEKELSISSVFSKRVLEENQEVYDMLCTSVGFSEQKLMETAKEMKEIITDDKLKSYKEIIPKTWIDSVGKTHVDLMFQVIEQRFETIIEIARMIIEERRK